MPATGPQVGIREVRKAHGLTLPALAERIESYGIEVHPDALSNIELGRKRASQHLLVAWAKALGVHPLDLGEYVDVAPIRKVAS